MHDRCHVCGDTAASDAIMEEMAALREESGTAPPRFDRGFMLLRWASLLYTAYFFVTPLHRHSLAGWLLFAAFYACFCTLYAAATTGEEADRKLYITLAALTLLGFVYYPLDPHAFGVFVYPFVIYAFYAVSLRALLLGFVGLAACVGLETWLLGFPLKNMEMLLIFSAVIGSSNRAYAQQRRTSQLLAEANVEIERLTQAAERERIARDLHDLLGHTLTVITVKLDLAQKLFFSNAERARDEVRDARQTARTALSEVREAVAGYRSEGLPQEISRARRSLQSAQVALTASLAPVQATPEQLQVLCLAVRESVTNIIRHAGAANCRLHLTATEGELLLTVADDGVGEAVREGNGIAGMRERVRSLGGRLTLSSAKGEGTTLRVSLPLTLASKVNSMRSCEETRA